MYLHGLEVSRWHANLELNLLLSDALNNARRTRQQVRHECKIRRRTRQQVGTTRERVKSDVVPYRWLSQSNARTTCTTGRFSFSFFFFSTWINNNKMWWNKTKNAHDSLAYRSASTTIIIIIRCVLYYRACVYIIIILRMAWGRKPVRCCRENDDNILASHRARRARPRPPQEYDINFYWFEERDLLPDEMYRSRQRWQRYWVSCAYAAEPTAISVKFTYWTDR